jgi:glycopeptide antibiotics resistance protein
VTIYLKSVLPIILPALAVFLWHLRTRRRFTSGRLVATGGFAVYLLLVSSYTIFPLWFDSNYIEAFRSETEFFDGVNLIPLRDLSLEYLLSIQGWGNVVLGMPFGFMYPFVVTVAGWRQMARYGVIFGASIELTQLAISLLYGFAYRVIDINDVLLNFTGAMLGYALLRTVALLYQAVSRPSSREASPPAESLWGHIASTLLQHGRRDKALPYQR